MIRTPEQLSVDVGDMELTVWYWPGDNGSEGDPLVFLHATGFHARCWDSIIEDAPNHPTYAVDLRFHGSSGKVGDVEWPVMAADVAVALERLNLRNALIVGHSIGGYLATVAAAAQAERVAQLLLLDPVIMAPERYAFAEQMRGFMKPEHNPISRRRNAWADGGEMYARFKDRAPFSLWQDRVLRDFCDHALAPGDAPRKLACDPLHEVQIYMNQNGAVIQDALTRVEVPVTILRAEEATEADDPFDMSKSPTWPKVAEQFANAREIYLPELTHFIPMQAPDLVVGYIREALEGRWWQP